MSLLRNILFNRLSQITCLVVPKQPVLLGRRYLTKESDVNSETTENRPDNIVAEDGGSVKEEIAYDDLTNEEMLIPGVYFPTLEVFETSYDGVMYGDLPLVRMIFSRNNLKMGAHTSDGVKTYSFKTAGSMGFKNAEKRSTVAAQTTGYSVGDDLRRKKVKNVRVELVGLHPSRLPAMMGILQAGINIVSISDRTRLSFYTKPPKPKKK